MALSTQHCGTAPGPFTLSNLWTCSRKHQPWNHSVPPAASLPSKTWQIQPSSGQRSCWHSPRPGMHLITPGTSWKPSRAHRGSGQGSSWPGCGITVLHSSLWCGRCFPWLLQQSRVPGLSFLTGAIHAPSASQGLPHPVSPRCSSR